MTVLWTIVAMWYICGLVGVGIELYSNWYTQERHITVSMLLVLLAVTVMGMWGLYMITNEYREEIWCTVKDIILVRNSANTDDDE